LRIRLINEVDNCTEEQYSHIGKFSNLGHETIRKGGKFLRKIKLQVQATAAAGCSVNSE
jgi:hypothetical protein